MQLKLTVYTDDSFTDVKRVVEADGLKIPYRVTKYLAETLENLNIKNENEVFDFIIHNLDKLDKIIKATFGLSETEMECIDTMELGAVGVELYKWGMDKIKSLKQGNNSKNVETTA
jgi:hypothetical protein